MGLLSRLEYIFLSSALDQLEKKEVANIILTRDQRFSVVGLSFDYEVYNIIGFLCYTAFNAAFYWSSYIQGQYEAQHHGDI
jgi:hypothetical protein